MFTNNYIKFRKAIFEAQSYNTVVSSSFKNADGTSFTPYQGYLYATDLGYWLKKARVRSIVGYGSGSYHNTESPLYCGVYFGSGSTPATKGDFTLESPITSGLSVANPTSLNYVDCGDGKYEICADYVVRNTTDSDINIYEVGVFTPMAAGYDTTFNYSSNKLHNVLMERTVLTEPITIKPGESKLVTYKITFNQTLNVEQ